ncbi:hypothetical protein PGIGA_G00164810 [Pangasianodon gigas]|uniref:Uncharacterized protein n=1 Tax=Pangasianodon gigas TaxID=30993 RepID=A0ACC5XU45_PANGG|nr:hypothetical protein [Pangasianodon gigas]
MSMVFSLGFGEDLKNCNAKLTEKTDYSFNIEKDLFALKEQLRVIKLSCINASQASSVQVAALQNQIDTMLKNLGEKATGPAAAVLNILQEYVKAQKLELELLVETDPKKIAEMQEQLKKARADLEVLGGKLNKLECKNVGKETSEDSDRISELLGRNQYLEEKIADTLAECNDLQENYNILDIVTLNQEINNLEDRIRSETSESKRNELQKELREKKEQLKLKTKDITDPDQKKTLTIISKLDELRKLQNENAGVDQIKDKKDELLGLLSELDDSNLAKIMLKNMVLLSDESQIKKQISDLKQQTDKQIAELQEEVRKKDEQLRRKTTELGQKDSDVATLKLEKQLSETRKELEKGNKALQEKNAELAKIGERMITTR